MLDYVVEQTDKYIISKPKSERKVLGQFFTSKATARFMASLFDMPRQCIIKLLDPGAGSGILSAALIEAIERYDNSLQVELTCYETNPDVIALLRSNLEYIRQKSRLRLSLRIVDEHYILSQSDDFSGNLTASMFPTKYDLVIANPPYYKLAKAAPEAASMKSVCHGAPNIYFLFAAMSLFNLREGGELVYIIPRSWTSGAYFTHFRKYFLKYGKITDIHLFISRDKVFDKEQILQETMIVKVLKTSVAPRMVNITSSLDSNNFENNTLLHAPYETVVSGDEKYVYLPISHKEINVLEKVNSIGKPLASIGLKMKTGLTVDFRNRRLLRNTSGENTVPLFYSQHLKGGRVVFPIGKGYEYMSDELSGVVQSNKNYLFVKRFTAKEEKRRLQCAVYLAKRFPEFKRISTQNKINFIDTVDNSDMSDELVH
ncbi:MAG: Eco57I restriction-modification methylase domain-containing protein, partial [Deferribacteraceae bacterium]|nr:Eco57I restriction-modification methylase domain-containing protein [Deferribacteraceae bacterium]